MNAKLLDRGKCSYKPNPFNNVKTDDCFYLPKNPPFQESCSKMETYDYFENSEWTFISTFTGIGIIILGKR